LRLSKRALVGRVNLFAEASEDYFFERLVSAEFRNGFAYRDFGGFIDRKAIDAATDGGKGQCVQFVFACQAKTIAVTAGQ
jgi:hypothetical protein